MSGRERTTRAFLWLAVLCGGPLVGAKLFDLVVLAGAWSANPPVSLRMMPYGKAWPVDTGVFFIPFSAALLVAGFGALVAGWRTPWRYRWLLCVPSVGILVLLILTVTAFWPMNAALWYHGQGSSKDVLSDAGSVAMARLWVQLDWVRVVGASAAFVAALRRPHPALAARRCAARRTRGPRRLAGGPDRRRRVRRVVRHEPLTPRPRAPSPILINPVPHVGSGPHCRHQRTRPGGADAAVTDQSFKFPRFFVTAPAPCPYVPGRFERKVFAELKRRDAPEMNEALARIGFRRSQNIVYRPSCDDCQACVSVRVVAAEFVPGASQKRLLKRHADLVVSACEPWSTQEQFDLLTDYVGIRHPRGGMAMMDAYDFADMIEQTPVDTVVVEYREPPVDGKPGRLVGACLTDKQSDGLSMVYSFYAPDYPARPGLGTFIILDHIVRAQRAALPFVYLGYWIDGCDRMAYKTRFKPVEMLTPKGWVRAA